MGKVEVGDEFKVDIIRISENGDGFGIYDDKAVIVKGVVDGDETVKVSVEELFLETILARKVSIAVSNGVSHAPSIIDDPYAQDSEDSEDDEGF